MKGPRPYFNDSPPDARIVIGCAMNHSVSQEAVVLLIRDIFYCKPGQVRPMVDKFLAMSRLSEKKGMGKFRVMTDVSAERYWTVVAEMEVQSIDAFMSMMQNSEEMKEMGELMKGYHDLVDSGRREIYKIEG